MWNKELYVREQQDAYEFFTSLIDQMDEYLKVENISLSLCLPQSVVREQSCRIWDDCETYRSESGHLEHPTCNSFPLGLNMKTDTDH